MHRHKATRHLALAALLSGLSMSVAASSSALLQPQVLVADQSLPAAQLEAQVLAARRYASFWASGDAALARSALAPDFTDQTLPKGRPQGLEGPLAASQGFRAAVPDLNCRIEQLLVAGDRVVVHLRFTGHFSGSFKGRQGAGQAIDFIASDIYRIADGRIRENWHIEDNLSLLQQMGLAGQ